MGLLPSALGGGSAGGLVEDGHRRRMRASPEPSCERVEVAQLVDGFRGGDGVEARVDPLLGCQAGIVGIELVGLVVAQVGAADFGVGVRADCALVGFDQASSG